MSSAPKPLVVDRVHVWRGDRHVLRGVSCSVAAGEALHVHGENGSGKTTLLRVITGLMRPESGSVSWHGTAIQADRAGYLAAMTYASHEPALKGDLTALENLRFAVGMKRAVADAELRDTLQRVGVAACADLPARVLSAGQRRRVALARVIAVRAELWVLDEPFTNLDARGAQLLVQLIEDHLAGGGLALIVAHQELSVCGALRQLELAA
jgi:heme exporter protein A